MQRNEYMGKIILYTTFLVIQMLFGSAMVFSQTADVKWNGVNYTVVLKNEKGEAVDTSQYGPIKPFVKEGYLYTVMINPNSDYHNGYTFWISLHDIKESTLKVIKEYTFSVQSADKQNCRARYKLMNSFEVSLTKKKLVIKFGYDKNRTKMKFDLNEVNLKMMSDRICEDLMKKYSSSEYCFICK